jgi:hypothetical protein
VEEILRLIKKGILQLKSNVVRAENTGYGSKQGKE